MCECLEYEDGGMYLCECCTDLRRLMQQDLAEVTRQRDELVKAVEAAKPGYTRMRGTEDIIYHHTVHTLIALAARIQSTQPKEPDHG